MRLPSRPTKARMATKVAPPDRGLPEDNHNNEDNQRRMSDDKLKPLRDQIDAIDAQLLSLLNQRARVAVHDRLRRPLVPGR